MHTEKNKKTGTETTVVLCFTWIADHLMQLFCSPSFKHFDFFSIYDIFALAVSYIHCRWRQLCIVVGVTAGKLNARQ